MPGHEMSSGAMQCVMLAMAVVIVLLLVYPREGAWFKKAPERMAVGNVFAGTTYGIQGRLRGDFFVPKGVVPSTTPVITGWVVPGYHKPPVNMTI